MDHAILVSPPSQRSAVRVTLRVEYGELTIERSFERDTVDDGVAYQARDIGSAMVTSTVAALQAEYGPHSVSLTDTTIDAAQEVRA